MKIRHKLYGLSAGLLLASALVMLVGRSGLGSIEVDVTEAGDTVLASELLVNLDRDAYQAQLALTQLVAGAEGEVRETALADFAENAEQTWTRFEEYQALALETPDELALWEQYESTREQWLADADLLLAALAAPDGADGVDAAEVQTVLARTRASFEPMRAHLDDLQARIYEPYNAELGPRVSSAASGTSRWMLLTFGVALVGGVVLTWLLSRTFARPLAQLTEAAGAMAVGDTDHPVTHTSRDELGQLADSFRAMSAHVGEVSSALDEISHGRTDVEIRARGDKDGLSRSALRLADVVRADALRQAETDRLTEQLSTVFESIAQYAGAIASSSAELTTIAEQMASTAEETSAQAEQMSSASSIMRDHTGLLTTGVEEIRTGISEVGRNSSEASSIAARAVELAERTRAAVQALGDSSDEIGQVVEMITSIAEETNLLALNATIEAARAGEAGKGFAVVANEVKTLATETGKATGEIRRQIGTIQADTRAVVEAIREISDVVGSINEAQSCIAAVVEEQTASATEVVRSVGVATSGTDEIADSISGVALAAQTTAAGASQTEAAARELAGLAAELLELVNRQHAGASRRTPPAAAAAEAAPSAAPPRPAYSYVG
jgi:methyl-accepting chemotaxis protein